MKTRVELALWGATALMLGAAVGGALRPLEAFARSALTESSPIPAFRNAGEYQRLADGIIASDPFRLARAPSPARFDPRRRQELHAESVTPQQSKPVLVLRAIVGGPPWEALIEGLPGRPAPALVRIGDTLGGLRIQSVRRDTVTVAGMDTVWRLTIAGGREW